MAQDWIEDLPVAIASIEYRLPPEHPHPAPVDDCLTALRWIYAHCEELGADPDRLILAGVSAGGGLAAATALANADRDRVPLRGLVLNAPMLDDRCSSGSMRGLAGVGIVERVTCLTGWNALLEGRAGASDTSAYAAPGRAADPSRLPPTYLDIGSVDTFRDETVAFATRMWEVGGDAELHVWPGGFHGFEGAVPTAPLSEAARVARRRWLSRIAGLG